MPFYKPDVATLSRDLVGKITRNFNDIARVINNLTDENIANGAGIKASKIDGEISGGSNTNITTIVEGTSYVKIWVISDSRLIPADDIYATTGVNLVGDGTLNVEGELTIL